MGPRLTIVLPLKGRHLFTFRFLWHAKQLRLPYRFLIADGQVNETVATCFEGVGNIFPELDIEYLRYPNDTDYSRYFAKMYDAMRRVRTPYVMLADNDDFCGFHGIERALDFLDLNNDYICARGRSVGFIVYSGLGSQRGAVFGRFNRLRMHSDFKSAAAPTARERLRQATLSDALYYAIYRTAVPVRIWQEIAELNFSDLMLHENFYGLRALTLGKAHANTRTVTYYTQGHSGISYQPLRDWIQHLLRTNFTSGARALVERIAWATADADGTEGGTIVEDIWSLLEHYYRDFLSANYGLVAQIKHAMRKKWPRVVSYVQTRPRFSVERERASLLVQLKDAGASSDDLKHIRSELAAIERTLSPKSFNQFAGPFLEMAQGGGGREWLFLGE